MLIECFILQPPGVASVAQEDWANNAHSLSFFSPSTFYFRPFIMNALRSFMGGCVHECFQSGSASTAARARSHAARNLRGRDTCWWRGVDWILLAPFDGINHCSTSSSFSSFIVTPANRLRDSRSKQRAHFHVIRIVVDLCLEWLYLVENVFGLQECDAGLKPTRPPFGTKFWTFPRVCVQKSTEPAVRQQKNNT